MLFISKTLQYPSCACVRNILKIVTFVTGKVKLVSFSFFLDVFPPRPRMPFGQWHVALNIYNICKGRLGSRGERGCRSQRRHQTSDKNRLFCQMVVFIVHQLYKKYILYHYRPIVCLSVTVYFTYMLLKYSRTSMARTGLGPSKIVLAKGSSSHPGWIMH